MSLQHRKSFKILAVAGGLLLACLLLVLINTVNLGFDEVRETGLDADFITTSDEIADEMLRLAEVNENDVVYDLGCGDGRIVVAAVRDFGAKGVGIDLNPVRIAESINNARAAGVEDRTRFEVGNFFEVDFSDATVVMLYLPARLNLQLRPIIWKQLKVGSRVVSNDSTMGPDWPPEKTSAARASDASFNPIYMWTITEEQKKAVEGMKTPTSAVNNSGI